MTRRITFTALALLAFASIAHAGIVDPANSSATMANPPAIIMTQPGGDGDSFLSPTNHLIEVNVADSGGNPVEIVASDIWLDNPETVPCPGGWIADSSTYAPGAGLTTFSGTPRGGVGAGDLCQDGQTNVVAVGQVIGVLDLRFVSADLNGDGGVTVADFGIFATAFNQPCTATRWCANLNKDGGDPCVTVADFGIFATYFNLSFCP